MTLLTCTNVSIPVNIFLGLSVPIAGRLCVPAGATSIQLLVHGFTEGQYYWDSPFQPDKYSYVAAANRAGYATLNLDLLGIGDSGHPNSALVSLVNQVDVVNQIIQALRSGQVGGTAFQKVVLVGHSNGSLISFTTAGLHQNVDALVATGASHLPNLGNLLTRIVAACGPAMLDPKFAASGLDIGYQTTRPGTRTALFNTQNTDPAVIALSEQLKQTLGFLELITALPSLVLGASKQINIPVLAVNSTDEPFFGNGPPSADCSSKEKMIASELPFYGPDVTLHALVVPDAGHAVTLALSAPQTLAAIQDWLLDKVPPS